MALLFTESKQEDLVNMIAAEVRENRRRVAAAAHSTSFAGARRNAERELADGILHL